MPATILAPLSGDIVSSPVTVSYSYTFSSMTNVTCYVGVDHDGGTNLNGGPATNSGSVTTLLTGAQTVAIKSGLIPLDHQDNVLITPGPPPIGIGGISFTTTASSTKTYTVKGSCDPNITPNLAFVVCLAIEIDPSTNTRTPVTVGFDVPTGTTKSWQVTLKVKTVAGMNYVARAFLFDVDFNKLGSFSKVLA
jgi:hypothetical protein